MSEPFALFGCKMARPRSAGNTARPLTNQRKDRIMAKADLTAQRLRELIHYNPETGDFTRLSTGLPCGRPFPGANGKRYAEIYVDQFKTRAHRIAWLYMTGEWPKGALDHINRNRFDNRWVNLREVTPKENIENQMRASKAALGFEGIYRKPGSLLYSAYINHNGQRIFLGSFLDAETAKAARRAAKLNMYTCSPEHQNPTPTRTADGAALAVWELSQSKLESIDVILGKIKVVLLNYAAASREGVPLFTKPEGMA
jgi:hypothetical protein